MAQSTLYFVVPVRESRGDAAGPKLATHIGFVTDLQLLVAAATRSASLVLLVRGAVDLGLLFCFAAPATICLLYRLLLRSDAMSLDWRLECFCVERCLCSEPGAQDDFTQSSDFPTPLISCGGSSSDISCCSLTH